MATRYVSVTGNDGAAGTIGAPWQTLRFATSQLAAGDTLLVRAGTYTGPENAIDSNIVTLATGTSIAPITVSAYPGGLSASTTAGPRGGAEVVIIQTPNNVQPLRLSTGGPQYWIFEDLTTDGINNSNASISEDVTLSGGSSHTIVLHCEVKNSFHNGIVTSQTNGVSTNNSIQYCALHDCGRDTSFTNSGYGFYINTANNLVEGCDIYNNHGYGGQINNAVGFDASNNVIRYTKFHHNVVNSGAPFGGTTGGGFNFGCNDVGHCDNTQVYNCLIYANGTGGPFGSQGHGISIFNNASNSLIYNNTITGNLGDGITLQYYSPVGNTLRNNIIFNNRDGTIVDSGDINGNFGNYTHDHNPTTDPTFVNASAFNFHLQGTSSAINAGATIALVTDDFDRVARPQGSAYCIGAYEWVVTGSPIGSAFGAATVLGVSGGSTRSVGSAGGSSLVIGVSGLTTPSGLGVTPFTYVLTINGVAQKFLQDTTFQISASLMAVGSLTANIVSADGSYIPPLDATVFLTEAGVVIFGGTIQTVTTQGAVGYGAVTTGYGSTTPLISTINCVDFNSLPDRIAFPYVANASLKSVLDDVVNTPAGLVQYGVMVDPYQVTGPSIPATFYVWQTVATMLNDWNVQTNYVWEIDATLRCRMFPVGAYGTPWSVVEGDRRLVGDLSVETSRADANNKFTNYVVVVGGASLLTIPIVSNAIGADSVVTTSVPHGLFTGEVITIAGVVGSVPDINGQQTVLFIDATHFSIPVAVVSPGSGGTITKSLAFGYALDLPSIKTFGMTMIVLSQPTLTTSAECFTYAAAYLAQKDIVPQTVVYLTYQGGSNLPIPGRTQPITKANRGVNGSFLITDVQTSCQNGRLLRQVTAVSGPVLSGLFVLGHSGADTGAAPIYQGSWRDVYKGWGGSSASSSASVSGGTFPITWPLAVLPLADGTVAAPSLSFASEPDLGIYKQGAGRLGFASEDTAIIDVGMRTLSGSPTPVVTMDPAAMLAWLVPTTLANGPSIQARTGGLTLGVSDTSVPGDVTGTFNLGVLNSRLGGGNPAASGFIRMQGQTFINWRNNAGSADVIGITQDSSDAIVVGTNGKVIVGGNNVAGNAFICGPTFTTITQDLGIAAAASTTSAIAIPANAVVLGVSVCVTSAIPTASTFTVTSATPTETWNTAPVSTAHGSQDPGTAPGPVYQSTASNITITPNLTPANGTGQVRIAISYYVITPPHT